MTAKEKKLFSELIIAIGYALDSIDVRATDPRKFESKQKATRLLEKLMESLK